MFMILIDVFQGAMLFAGLSLAFNVVAFTSTNWGFIFLLTMIGALLGALAGALMRSAEPANVWALPLGSMTVAMIVGIFAMAFDFFIFGVDKMHWRAIIALSLISSAPGLIVGWILAHQFSVGDGHQPSISPRFPGVSDVRQPMPPALREPLPVVQTQADFHRVRWQQLEQMLQAEIRQFPSGMQATASQPVGDSDNVCVTATLNRRGQTFKFYLVCTPDYPDEPPQLLTEQIDRLQDSAGQEVRYRSQVIQQWGPGSRLYQVVDEVYQVFSRR